MSDEPKKLDPTRVEAPIHFERPAKEYPYFRIRNLNVSAIANKPTSATWSLEWYDVKEDGVTIETPPDNEKPPFEVNISDIFEDAKTDQDLGNALSVVMGYLFQRGIAEYIKTIS